MFDTGGTMGKTNCDDPEKNNSCGFLPGQHLEEILLTHLSVEICNTFKVVIG